MRNVDLETEGNEVASSCQEREAALRCWRDLVDTSGLQDKVLADAAGMKVPHFSKVSSGQQGDFLGMIFRIGKTYPELRSAFIERLAEIERADPLAQALEQLIHAALRVVRLQAERVPKRIPKADALSSHHRERGVA